MTDNMGLKPTTLEKISIKTKACPTMLSPSIKVEMVQLG